MKKKLLCLLAIFALLAAAPAARAQSAEDIVGDYASVAPAGITVPAGHFALIATYADAFLNTPPGGSRTVFADTLAGGAINNYYLLDIRAAADYAKGHIAGAVNVQLADVANPGVLAMLPTDRKILVICYTGHTASVATAILGTLGYDAYTLRFGMMSWNATTNMKVYSPALQIIYGGGYPVVTGPNP